MKKHFTKFSEFYPYYIEEHKNKHTKLFHFIGSCLFIYFFLKFLITFEVNNLVFAIVSAYGLAWISHFFIEKNKPATFDYPVYSFMGDCVMFTEIIQGKHKIL